MFNIFRLCSLTELTSEPPIILVFFTPQRQASIKQFSRGFNGTLNLHGVFGVAVVVVEVVVVAVVVVKGVVIVAKVAAGIVLPVLAIN